MTRVSAGYPAVVVVGDGIVGRTIALQLGARGAPVTMVAPVLHGAASLASAGMLAPSVERTQGPAQAFSDASVEAWDRLSALVASVSGEHLPVHTDGILRVALSEAGAQALTATVGPADQWLGPAEVRTLAPSIGPVVGGALYARNGYVDVPVAMSLLGRVLELLPAVKRRTGAVTALDVGPTGVRVVIDGVSTVEGEVAILAAGAWAPSVPGVPARLPITPVRGVLLAVDGSLAPVPVYSAEGHTYVLPRRDGTRDGMVVGATSDAAGFDSSANDTDLPRLTEAGARLFPGIGASVRGVLRAGLRPVTPDGLPVIGRDANFPPLLYACGHGRNGFLHAALTSEVIASLAFNDHPLIDISAFGSSRFSGE